MSSKVVPKFTMIKVIIIIGILLFAASFVAWWRLVYSNPTNVFNRMLASSLATPAVTKTVTQTDESQDLKQVSTLMTSPDQIVQSVSTLIQADDSGTRVVTESIGTPTTDYVRYVDIQTTQKNAEGAEYDFSDVLGVWGKTSSEDQANGNVQLFSQTVLGVVPIANLNQSDRAKLLQLIQKEEVYKIDTDAVKRQLVNGRPVYSYKVAINPVAYVRMLKSFARTVGLTQLEQVDPSQYEGSAPLEFTFEIDVWSGQLKNISYGGTERKEATAAHGIRLPIQEPSSSIGVEELQARLQQVQ